MMNNLLELKEYEYITCNKEYESEHFKYLNEKDFNCLEEYILSFEQSEQSEAIDFLKPSIQRNIGKVIQAKNYVGLLQLNSGLQVQILPKIDGLNETDTKRTFIKMLRSIKDFPCKVFTDSHLKTNKMNLYEIFISMFIEETRQLIKTGLKSSYSNKEENLNFYKGHLCISQHIKSNSAHKEKFYMSYDEFNPNCPENRLIKTTLAKLLKNTSSNENAKEIRQLMVFFEDVDVSSNIEQDLNSVSINRNNKNYEMLIQWSKVFLTNKSFTTFSGNTNGRSILFPMEKVFESFVAKSLKQSVSDDFREISAQDTGYYLFDSPRQFALRPDIVITRNDGTRIVLDTKWKILNTNPNCNYGISQSDMYQMYAYSKKYKTPDIWLLYPETKETKSLKNIHFVSEDNVNVSVFFINMADIETSINELKEKLK